MRFRTLMAICVASTILLCLTVPCFSTDECELYKPGVVFTMTNCYCGNSILAFQRSGQGILSPDGVFPTGGWGTGDGLGNQGGLILSHNGQWLFACNAGSNEITVFRVMPKGLERTDIVSSEGLLPISLTLYKNTLYVLNAGGSVGGVDEITGFIFDKGKLYHIADSTWPLSETSTSPAQIGFSTSGDAVVVTEKATNLIDVYPMDGAIIVDHRIFMSAGQTPFGFAFRKDILVVTEVFGIAPDAGTVSSYKVHGDGQLMSIDPTVPTTETATCWIVITKNGRFAYTTNSASNSVSGFFVGKHGNLTLLDPDGVTGSTGMGTLPIDMALSVNSQFLYTLNAGDGTMSVFKVNNSDGSLMPLPGIGGIPQGANGLAAH